MANNREILQPPKLWEFWGLFFGYFASAKDAPLILRKLHIAGLVPEAIRKKLLQWDPRGDHWLFYFYTLLPFLALLWLWLFRARDDEDDKSDNRSRAIAVLQRGRRIRLIRTLGLVLIREFLLDRLGVSLYGTFRRPDHWPLEPQRSMFIDRLTLTNGTGIEYQYGKNFEQIFIRTHPKGDINYGETKERAPEWEDIKILIVASNYFLFWIVVYLLKKPLSFFFLKKR